MSQIVGMTQPPADNVDQAFINRQVAIQRILAKSREGN
jgi:hypothetical protein